MTGKAVNKFIKLFAFAVTMGYFRLAMAQTTFALPNPLACNDLGCVTDKIIDGLFALSIPAVAIAVMVGGFQIASAGTPERAKNGAKTIQYAVIGFIAILFAKSISLILQSIF